MRLTPGTSALISATAMYWATSNKPASNSPLPRLGPEDYNDEFAQEYARVSHAIGGLLYSLGEIIVQYDKFFKDYTSNYFRQVENIEYIANYSTGNVSPLFKSETRMVASVADASRRSTTYLIDGSALEIIPAVEELVTGYKALLAKQALFDLFAKGLDGRYAGQQISAAIEAARIPEPTPGEPGMVAAWFKETFSETSELAKEYVKRTLSDLGLNKKLIDNVRRGAYVVTAALAGYLAYELSLST